MKSYSTDPMKYSDYIISYRLYGGPINKQTDHLFVLNAKMNLEKSIYVFFLIQTSLTIWYQLRPG